MPKTTKSLSAKLKYFVKHYGKHILETYGQVLMSHMLDRIKSI